MRGASLARWPESKGRAQGLAFAPTTVVDWLRPNVRTSHLEQGLKKQGNYKTFEGYCTSMAQEIKENS